MEILLWLVVLAYMFSVGYFAVCKLEKFMSKNPRAFPGNRKIIAVLPSSWQNPLEDDSTCMICYNKCTNCKELENHEKCDS